MSVELIDKIKPKNNGGFALVDAADVEMPDGTRLSDLEVQNGKNGEPGKDGADGYTPVRGTDYWTDADKQEINADTSAYVDSLFVSITQEGYDALVAAGTVDPAKYYMIVGDST